MIGPSPSSIAAVSDALLDVLARRDHRGSPVVETDRRRTGRARQALLQAGGRHVDLPGVHLERVAAQRGGAIDVEQHVVLAAQRADLRERLQHGRGRVAVTDRDHARTMLLDCGLDLARVEDPAPFRLDRDDVGAEAPSDFHLEVAETSEHRHQQRVARRKRGSEARLDAGARRAVDQQRPPVVGPEDAAVQRHHLIHVAGELRIELTLQRHRHRPQHPRIDIDRPRPHQQAGLGIKLGEEFRRRRRGRAALLALVKFVQEIAPNVRRNQCEP